MGFPLDIVRDTIPPIFKVYRGDTDHMGIAAARLDTVPDTILTAPF